MKDRIIKSKITQVTPGIKVQTERLVRKKPEFANKSIDELSEEIYFRCMEIMRRLHGSRKERKL